MSDRQMVDPLQRWEWKPSNDVPLQADMPDGAPRHDTDELISHLAKICGAGASIAEAEQIWLRGAALISRRMRQIGSRGTGNNHMLTFRNGNWNFYVGPPPPGEGAPMLRLKFSGSRWGNEAYRDPNAIEYGYALGFNSESQTIVKGRYPRKLPADKNAQQVLDEFLSGSTFIHQGSAA